ncbi:hypothetical protein [Isoptericola sp. NPDC055881]
MQPTTSTDLRLHDVMRLAVRDGEASLTTRDLLPRVGARPPG